jgi:chromosome segregation ATPase
MNAMLLSERDPPARRLVWPRVGIKQMDAQLARLESDVGHIQNDTTDIKEDLRRTNVRIDALEPRLDKIRDKIDEADKHLGEKLDRSHREQTDDLESLRKETAGNIATLRGEIAAVRDMVITVKDTVAATQVMVASMKLWTLRLVVGAGCTILLVIAQAFKWI